jgi:hypothetical protein
VTDLRLYAVVVDQLVDRLTREERQTLRTQNRLPHWLLPAVDQNFERLARVDRR